jgi:hypothetical protein
LRVGALAPIALALSFVSAQAGAQQEQKTPQPLPAMEDIKTPPPVLPPKPPAPPRVAVPLEQVLQQEQVKLPAGLEHVRASYDPEAVYFDQPGDGSLWTMGRVYKAQFSAQSATYYPNMGPKAPALYPLSFQLAGVAVGGTPIAFSGDVSAVRAGDAVQYERGGLTEQYQIRAGSVEQQFVFRTLPGSGELVVQLAVDTELAGSSSAEGFRFGNELGYVSYGRAVAIDAAGHQVDALTTLDGDRIEIRVPAAFVADAVLPLLIDPVITTFAIDTSTSFDTQPDVAYDVGTARFLVCWEREYSSTDHDVWAEQWTTGGTLVASSGAYIDFTSDYWATPRVGNNNLGNIYLVAARVGTSSPREIRGRTRDNNSLTMGAQFTISATPTYDCLSPDVGGDPATVGPTYFLVVWRRVYISGTDDDVHGRLVDSTGALSGSTIFIDNSAGTYDTDPNVSKSDGLAPFTTQEWTVTWTREFTAGVDYDIWGSQVHWSGAITHPTYMIDYSGAYDYNSNPSTIIDGASGERDYMVVYQRYDGVGDRDIHGAVYNGTVYVDDRNLSALDTSVGQNQVNPCVDSDGGRYAVAYSEQYSTSTFDYDMYISTFSRVGSEIKCAEAHELLDFSTTQDNNPQIAARHGAAGSTTQAMVVWSSLTSGSTDCDIQGGIYETNEFTSFCFPGVDVAACPCGNPPSSVGRGCNNSSNTGGAILTQSGSADLSADSVVFTATGEKPTATSIFLQGTLASSGGISFGQGIRCATGTLKRLYTKTAVGGVVTAPQGGDPDVSTRSATLGDTIGAGETRYYVVYYRDPIVLGGCAATRTFNVTQTGAVSWIP